VVVSFSAGSYPGYICSGCKGRHATLKSLRECQESLSGFGNQYSATVLGTALGNSMKIDPPPPWQRSGAAERVALPTGNYLITVVMPDSSAKSIHIRVGAIRSGKWNNCYFVSMYDEEQRKLLPIRSTKDRAGIILKLQTGNWQRALCDYGRAFSECPICELPLTVAELKLGAHATEECTGIIYN
jgi:hypothetical protein